VSRRRRAGRSPIDFSAICRIAAAAGAAGRVGRCIATRRVAALLNLDQLDIEDQQSYGADFPP
jgi:hypothetical protein